MKNKTVLIFGVFDGIHEGHRFFIHESKKYGDRLVVIVARESITLEHKSKKPINDEVSRINSLLEENDVDLVLLGDSKHGSYSVLKEVKPDVICFGYDQTELYNDVELNIKKGLLPKIKLIKIKPYKPEEYHSSILNK